MKACPRAIKWRASVLLTAAAALIIETACSEAPSPQSALQPTSSPSEIRSRLELYARDKAIIRIHTDDGIIIPTAFYSLTDSSVVIDHVLRGKDYIPELSEAHLFGGRKAKELPDNVALPLSVPLDRIASLQRWDFPSRPAPAGEEIGPRLAVYAAEEVVARIRTADGTVIPTSHFEVNDSTVVVGNVLRDDKYFPEAEEPRLYGKSGVTTLPRDVTLPIAIPLSDLATVDQWQDPHKTSNGIVTGVVIVAAVVLVAWFATTVEIGPSGEGERWTWR